MTVVCAIETMFSGNDDMNWGAEGGFVLIIIPAIVECESYSYFACTNMHSEMHLCTQTKTGNFHHCMTPYTVTVKMLPALLAKSKLNILRRISIHSSAWWDLHLLPVAVHT